MSYAGGIAAAVAAKKRREKREREEENMVQYSENDLKGWEFKIVRSSTGRFKNSEYLHKVVQEEAISGWELLEKFDDNRIRFKRRVEDRSRDLSGQSNIDPYRINVGINGNKLGFLIALAIMLLGAVLFAFIGAGMSIEIVNPQKLMIAVAVVIGLVAVILAFRKMRS